MKTRRDLVNAIHGQLTGLGYRRLPIRKGAAALFFKKVGRAFLTLGIEVSTRYRQAFTGSFYLAPAFSWAYAPPNGFPLKGYRRIGECLTPSQRKRIDPEATAGVVDIWWHGFTPENAQMFAESVGIAESRFLADRALLAAVATCPAMRELLHNLSAVRRAYLDKTLRESPKVDQVTTTNEVPTRWYHAAAQVARERAPDYDQQHGIKMLAEESWLLSEVAGRWRSQGRRLEAASRAGKPTPPRAGHVRNGRRPRQATGARTGRSR